MGEEFIDNEPCAMVLGDNIFYSGGFSSLLQKAIKNAEDGNTTVFGYYVNDSNRFSIMEFDKYWNIILIEEKIEHLKSNYCITGLYFYPKGVRKKAKEVEPSQRGELEISTLNDMYL